MSTAGAEAGLATAATATSARCGEAEVDAFGQKGPKWGALLGLPPSSRVLLFAPGAAARHADLSVHFPATSRVGSWRELAAALAAGAAYDLVFCDLSDPVALPGPAWGMLRRSLAPAGSLVLLVPNRLSLRDVARRPALLFARGLVTAWGYRRRLRRAGLALVEEFLPVPSMRNADEFISTRRGHVALPSHASRVEHALNRVGWLPLVHEGFVYIASARGVGPGALLAVLAKQLGTRPGFAGPLELERFDLRDRGALVLLLRSAAGAGRCVCRLTFSSEVDRVVARNTEWTARLQNEPRISAAVKRLVPAPLGTYPLPGCTAHVETLVEGVVAWKLAGLPAIEPRLFEGVYGFLRDFNRDTMRRPAAADGIVDALLSDVDPPWLGEDVAALLRELRARLQRRMSPRTHAVVWSHGDYGYGNVIVAPDSGAVRGVVDWDQARVDLAGVDLLNFLVQRDRGAHPRPLARVLGDLAAKLVPGGFRALDPRLDYDDFFPLDAAGRVELVAWLAVRLVERAARYPRLFAGSREESVAALGWARRLLEESEAG